MSLVSGKYRLFVREESRKSKEKCHLKANDSNIHRLLLLEKKRTLRSLRIYICVSLSVVTHLHVLTTWQEIVCMIMIMCGKVHR